MEIQLLTKQDYGVWDEFCANSEDAWFWHTTSWLDYCEAYAQCYKATNISFFVTDETGILAICPLLL